MRSPYCPICKAVTELHRQEFHDFCEAMLKRYLGQGPMPQRADYPTLTEGDQRAAHERAMDSPKVKEYQYEKRAREARQNSVHAGITVTNLFPIHYDKTRHPARPMSAFDGSGVIAEGRAWVVTQREGEYLTIELEGYETHINLRSVDVLSFPCITLTVSMVMRLSETDIRNADIFVSKSERFAAEPDEE